MNETTELIMKQLNSKKVHAETHEVGGGDEIDVLKLKNVGSLVTKTGDFSGTWNGLTMTSTEPGLSTAFDALKADTATNAETTESIKSIGAYYDSELIIRSKNYLDNVEGGGVSATAASGSANSSTAKNAFTVSGTQYWSPAAGSTYPFVLARSIPYVAKVNTLEIRWESAPAIPIILTHQVFTPAPSYSMSVANFQALCDSLSSNGYQPIWYSDFLTFLRTGVLPSGITKPVVIHFAGGYDNVYTNAYPILKSKGFKFNITVTETINTSGKITIAQAQEMIQYGLLQPHIYTSFNQITASLDGQSNSDIVRRPYDANSNSYETRSAYASRVSGRISVVKQIIRDQLGGAHELIAEIPQASYNRTHLRLLQRSGVSGAVNVGSDRLKYGTNPFPMIGAINAYDEVQSVTSIQNEVIARSGTAIPRTYSYEVYVSNIDNPTTTVGWELSSDWTKVVNTRSGGGITIDPLYYPSQNVEDLEIRHFRIKILSSSDSALPNVDYVNAYFEHTEETAVLEQRLSSVENRKLASYSTNSGSGAVTNGTTNYYSPTGMNLSFTLSCKSLIVVNYQSRVKSSIQNDLTAAIFVDGVNKDTVSAFPQAPVDKYVSMNGSYWIELDAGVHTIDIQYLQISTATMTVLNRMISAIIQPSNIV